MISIYNGEIVAGSLLINESITVAELIINGMSDSDIENTLFIQNPMQKRSRATIRRQTTLIKKRLLALPIPILSLITLQDRETVIQAILVGAIKHSHLLGDFMNSVLKDKVRTFQKTLLKSDWNKFLESCEQIDPLVKKWAPSTRIKLGQVVFRILAESKYIDSTRSLTIRPVLLSDKLRKLLVEHQETYALECLESGL